VSAPALPSLAVTARVTLVAVLAALTPPPARADDPGRFLARRTALLIEQFTRFIEWPADVLPETALFVLCLQGVSETSDELTRLAAIRKFKRRPTEVRKVRAGEDRSGCHVLYLAPSEAPRLQQALEAVAGKPVLTVSDSAGFVESGVHFNFFPVTRAQPTPGTYPHFEWSVPAVRRTIALRFDPVLLSQGRKVDNKITPAAHLPKDHKGRPEGRQ
jgi:hypothetical protein